jgi:hypothetical protein
MLDKKSKKIRALGRAANQVWSIQSWGKTRMMIVEKEIGVPTLNYWFQHFRYDKAEKAWIVKEHKDSKK